MIKILLLSTFLLFSSFFCFAQNATISGSVRDIQDNQSLEHSNVMLIHKVDSTLYQAIRADREGKFTLNNIPKGAYILQVTFPKMADYFYELIIETNLNIQLPVIEMELQSKIIEEVLITAKRAAMRLKGDTIIYAADLYKVSGGANVQELLKRLPGIQIDEDGVITAQGITVKKVLVEGDEFFGDDPLMATKYLRANAVKEVEVYDQKSRTAELTGIDDGVKNKTINIKLKDDAKRGFLGNLDINTNLDNFEDYGGMAGIFRNKLKAAVFGNQANIGLQSRANMAYNNVKGRDYDVIDVGDDVTASMLQAVEDIVNSTLQGGLPSNKILGAHLSDKTDNENASYKLNYKFSETGNENIATSVFQQLLPNQTLFTTRGDAHVNTVNRSHDLNGNTVVKIDSLSNFTVSFSFTETNSNANSADFIETTDNSGIIVSNNNQQNNGFGNSSLQKGNINYSKKFLKNGRSLSIDLQPLLSKSESTLKSANLANYFNSLGILSRSENLDLLKQNEAAQKSIASRINYSESLSNKISLLLSYSFKNSTSLSNRNSYDQNQLGTRNQISIDSLSNNFEFHTRSHLGKSVVQYKSLNFAFNVGLEATQTKFGLKNLDKGTTMTRNYLNLGPNSNLTYKISKNKSLNLLYHGTTNQPLLEQLQPIREINNPFYQIVGNSNLQPSFNNNIALTLNGTTKGYGFYSIGLQHVFIQNEIVAIENIDNTNKRTISYINVDGNKSYLGMANFEGPIANFEFSSIFIVSRTIRNTLINNSLNTSTNNTLTAKLGVMFPIKSFGLNYKLDLSINNGKSTIGELFSGNSLIHTHMMDLAIPLPYNLQFRNKFGLTFRPSNSAFREPLNIQQWDASVEARILKKKNLKLSAGVNDLLDQRIGYNRNISGNTVSESTFSYVPRYFLLGLNYDFSGNFKSKSPQ